MRKALETYEGPPLLVHLRPVLNMTDEQLLQLCPLNRELRIERTAEGDLIIMPPTGGKTGRRNLKLSSRLEIWAGQDATGIVFDSSTGFILLNGAERAPDVSWVRKSCLAALSEEEKEGFLPLCPDVVIELRSSSESWRHLNEKMSEYIENGARLERLIEPLSRRVNVFRSDGSIEELVEPLSLVGDPELPGFVLDLQDIWDLDSKSSLRPFHDGSASGFESNPPGSWIPLRVGGQMSKVYFAVYNHSVYIKLNSLRKRAQAFHKANASHVDQ